VRILIVDDSKAMRMIVKRTLRQAGFESHAVEEAENGADALRQIRAAPPDLVLCDWNMPEMTGIDLLRELAKNGPRVRFGFVTSEGVPEMKAQAKEAGALFFISKPFTPDQFRETLAGVVA
jgi:two-component system, chemotaxis family, chemotaxis protein CheY